ncbi:basic leucine zipper transcriptional factor ATF-like 3 [Cynoglossus semilaevis]|uniref:basic leucine zipper transcriptional factor ATF-like 3 n=1 Tax=Cynoglossus semilaevis TaxID=244447 RepID=UPI0007DCAAB2|nr:basic leucine zipper transcriptional factor ATF-like 3 [Cynoglossus semilaevis]
MSSSSMSSSSQHWQPVQDGGRRSQRKEKNRVAAQRSRSRQTQRADLLHQTCELLEQRNRKLRTEVESLCEQQHLLTEALRAHEPHCPVVHCFSSLTTLPPVVPFEQC